ncbi:hypothetical protein VCRLGP8_380058 [Vibrio crassostreae]|nr:hypothetical protein VCRLGP107_230063 [Vibrio crassostreae]CDT37057.1 hypothetical protein VCRLGP7_630065 [Vibrio crassostreae]CDT50600.1 hypothetical protein VCRLGP8_380058 [Vibrio crassostreae]
MKQVKKYNTNIVANLHNAKRNATIIRNANYKWLGYAIKNVR